MIDSSPLSVSTACKPLYGQLAFRKSLCVRHLCETQLWTLLTFIGLPLGILTALQISLRPIYLEELNSIVKCCSAFISLNWPLFYALNRAVLLNYRVYSWRLMENSHAKERTVLWLNALRSLDSMTRPDRRYWLSQLFESLRSTLTGPASSKGTFLDLLLPFRNYALWLFALFAQFWSEFQ